MKTGCLWKAGTASSIKECVFAKFTEVSGRVRLSSTQFPGLGCGSCNTKLENNNFLISPLPFWKHFAPLKRYYCDFHVDYFEIWMNSEIHKISNLQFGNYKPIDFKEWFDTLRWLKTILPIFEKYKEVDFELWLRNGSLLWILWLAANLNSCFLVLWMIHWMWPWSIVNWRRKLRMRRWS